MNSSGEKDLNRRQACRAFAGRVVAGVAFGGCFTAGRGLAGAVANPNSAGRRFTMDLCPGRIGVSANQREAIELAARFGFESVEPKAGFLANLSSAELAEVLALLESKRLRWGAAGLPVDFRGDESRFQNDLATLKQVAAGLEQAGVTRVGTWLSPASDELTYLQNFRQHTRRLRSVAAVLSQHQIRFGLEYVGPRTSWTSKKHAFIHSLAETRELIDEIAADNVGIVLDSWHWYTAEEDASDLARLTADDVVAVDLNDAPSGLDVSEQIDNRRELPSATGVIDVQAFLTALIKIGYDGPVRAEPFNQVLNELPDEEAVQATAKALRQAFTSVA